MEKNEVAILGGGCFWCLDGVFRKLNGVKEVVSGYSGGHTENPLYEDVCRGSTGHAEVLQIIFDPSVITFLELLEVFFVIHDPTTVDRQGNDVGSQYRSVIIYHSDHQKEIAEDYISSLDKKMIWSSGIVTQVIPYLEFYPAEDYHQNFAEKNPYHPYCQLVAAPKLVKVQEKFPDKLNYP